MRRYRSAPITAALASLWAFVTLASPGPTALAPTTPLPAPVDRPFPGAITLNVTASDVERRVLHVQETITGLSGEVLLLYPQWLPGNHGPTGPIDRVAGIRVSARGEAIRWRRDTVHVYALHVAVPAGTDRLDIEFDYLSPTGRDVGALEFSDTNLILDWNTVVLYPAGFYARQIPVTASLTLATDWTLGSALELETSAGPTSTFRRTDLETLIDSPVYAGRYGARFDLDPGGRSRVTLNVFADRPEHLEVSPMGLAAHRALVVQADRLYRSRHYAHYDFLYSLSDGVQHKGLEHHQSSENGAPPALFTDWEANAPERDLLAHEYSHSWNGKFRRPADLWTPNYNVPMQDSLLWVYEGQTEYWGQVLAARAGLRTAAQTLDQLALFAAYYEHQAGRASRPLQDTTNDAILNYHRPQSWRDYQRYMDYYTESVLVWLDADTLIRERSGGTRSLDDFAAAFFGIDDGSRTVKTYTFADVVRTLNAVLPYDWAAFLRERLDSTGRPAPLDGLARGGYRLIYTDTPSAYQKALDTAAKVEDLTFSIGLVLNAKDGSVESCRWQGPAFAAGLAHGNRIVAVNGIPYAPEVLEAAIRAAAKRPAPIELIVAAGERYRTTALRYEGGLRYPHLERVPEATARLDAILAPRER
jgi:predicted metalloprotease with PDZ domain